MSRLQPGFSMTEVPAIACVKDTSRYQLDRPTDGDDETV
jgi:hypothetical protein